MYNTNTYCTGIAVDGWRCF